MKKLDFNLEFLDKESPKTKQTAQTKSGKKRLENIDPSKWDWKVISTIGGVILVVLWIWSSGNGSDYTAPPADITPSITQSETTLLEEDTTIIAPKEDAPIIPKVKTNNQICKDTFGSHSYSTGVKNAADEPICDCQDGYIWNSTQTSCVVAPPPPKTNEEICKDMNGPYGTYNSFDNTCGCADGYNYGAVSETCVSFIEARDQSCAAEWSNTSFLKVDQTNGKNICDCEAGYYWNNERTACYSLTSFSQSCVNSYGEGSYSTTENGKRVCDCSYRYDWNLQRDTCITTESINQLCERDVGRNSYYKGYTEDGKYICSEPY